MILEDATFEAYGYYPSELKPHSGKLIVSACELCGEFRVGRKNAYHTFCIKCGEGRSVERNCLNCGKPFKAKPSSIKRGKGLFCSQSCAGHYHKGEKNNRYRDKIKRICKECHNIFYVTPSIALKNYGIYCSSECMRKARKTEKVKCVCKWCKKIFYVYPYALNRGRGKYCCQECVGKASRHKTKPAMTVPEKVFQNICTKNKLPFEFVVDGYFWIENNNPDFIHKSKKIVVEVFGDYWHSRLLNRKIKEKRTYIETKKRYKTNGYKCIIIWETDLKRKDAEAFVIGLMRKEGIV